MVSLVNFNILVPELVDEIFEQSLAAEVIKQKTAPSLEDGETYLEEFRKVYAIYSRVSKKWLEHASILLAKFINANRFELKPCGLKCLDDFISFGSREGSHYLKILDLGEAGLPNDDIGRIISIFTHVEEVFLGNEVKSLACLKPCRSIKCLSVENSAIESLNGLEGLTTLQELSLISCTKLANLENISGLTNLIFLDLSESCKPQSESDGLQFVKFPDLRSLNKLVSLSLFNADGITEHPEFLKDIVDLKAGNPNLNIDISPGIKDALAESEDMQANAKLFDVVV